MGPRLTHETEQLLTGRLRTIDCKNSVQMCEQHLSHLALG